MQNFAWHFRSFHVDSFNPLIMQKHSFTRREFVKLATGGAAFALVSFNYGCRNKISRWRTLEEDEISLLDEIAEQIIPTDDFPGGKWANVSSYIDKQLSSYYKDQRDTYRLGLAAFRQSVLREKGKKFEELDFADQLVMMEKMEAGQLGGEYWKIHPSGGFFEMLRQHCLQGFYGSPIHGGNRDYISYKMLGLDYPNVIGQNRYEDMSWRIYHPK